VSYFVEVTTLNKDVQINGLYENNGFVTKVVSRYEINPVLCVINQPLLFWWGALYAVFKDVGFYFSSFRLNITHLSLRKCVGGKTSCLVDTRKFMQHPVRNEVPNLFSMLYSGRSSPLYSFQFATNACISSALELAT